jgi:hypothetical protein
MGIIIVKSMVSQALIEFLAGSRSVFRSLHFIANQLGDLSMQERTMGQNDRAYTA